ncbi:MAG: tetratricopeptide repeat protein, partial [Bacteroidia bacterium]
QSKELEDISLKAQAIVSEKNFSNYIDEAYILLGKTNFYKGNYYNAAEYFDYVERAYKTNKKVYLNALNWKARTYMQLQNDKMALRLLDSVTVTLDSVKRGKADPLATLAQMSINLKDYKKAIDFLERAIKESSTTESRTRWHYILGQLYEHTEAYEASLKNYTKVERSNAPFEMYFNARLSKIRINNLINNNLFDRKEQLLKLIKDDKNLDYINQIYYEVAEDYYRSKNYKKAEEFYSLSASQSSINQNQKALSFLKLADLNFKELNNYVKAKLYYDSALNVLPKSYPNYQQLQKKAQNLEYLSERYKIIKHQDTLQLIARLAPEDRENKIAALFKPEIVPAVEKGNNGDKTDGSNTLSTSSRNNTFYFSSQAAISRGFTDFKKRWGNRILESNWRQSVKSSAQITQQNQVNSVVNGVPSLQGSSDLKEELTAKIKAYTASLPLTNEQVAKSNQQIINAYLEIGAFYQQVLEDQGEAVKVYEILLSRFPDNKALETIYYSLYLGHKGVDQAKSDQYKNLVLTKYPNSSYAKTILDPSYSSRQNALDLTINNLYNDIFSLYEKKDYKTVIASVNEANQRFPGNSLQAQYDYLKAISIGKTEHLDSLLPAFQKITTQYPADSLITPLIKGHLNYINNNLGLFSSRKIALLDFDETEPKFVEQKAPILAIVSPPNPQNQPAIPVPTPAASISPVPIQVPTISPIASGPKTDGLFSTAESSTYYFVVSVASMELSVSSSRFGIGQFNRGSYAGNNLRHQLNDLPEDQIIYVGNFPSINEVVNYAEEIKKQLPKIMKVPGNLYTSFIVSKENFEKIKDRATLNRYLEFFKANFE